MKAMGRAIMTWTAKFTDRNRVYKTRKTPINVTAKSHPIARLADC
jgi:hypothetical protein